MCICIPFVMFYRCCVYVCSCCFRNRDPPVTHFASSLEGLEEGSGGWYRDARKSYVCVRDTFYIFLFHRLQNDLDLTHVRAFVHKLTQAMTNEGQVPWCFQRKWLGENKPVYKSNDVRVIDANMQFIIMSWWLFEVQPETAKTLYLYCQRAWQWLDIHIANDSVHERIGASWEHSRQHEGTLLLSNVQLIHTIRCMELVHTVEKDQRKQKQFTQRHARAVSTWTPEIYKTQETLPRILAVCFNIVPRSFIKSFNQEMKPTWIPCRLPGPVPNRPTRDAWIYGYGDKHDTLIWPWIGFLWMVVLHTTNHKDIASKWWTSYMDFHKSQNLYDIYSADTRKPVRRAFLKGHAQHALTTAAYLTAKETHIDDLI